MSRLDDTDRLRHMLDYAREAWGMAQGASRSDLDTDRKLNLSLVRLLELVGEAATQISPTFRSKHGEIPWAQIVGLRNRLIHGYDEVDFDILWEILNRDLPVLVEKIGTVLPPKPGD